MTRKNEKYQEHSYGSINDAKLYNPWTVCGLLLGRKNSQDFDGDSEPFFGDMYRKIH